MLYVNAESFTNDENVIYPDILQNKPICCVARQTTHTNK